MSVRRETLLERLVNSTAALLLVWFGAIASAIYCGRCWGYGEGLKAGWRAVNTPEFRSK